MISALLPVSSVLLCLCAVGCRQPHLGQGTPDAGHDAFVGLPAPRADLVPAVGSPGALDIATWNIENFPGRPTTPSLVADLITSLDLDLVAVQEIAGVAAFDELDERLTAHHGILSPHTYSSGEYQKIGFLYRTDLLTAVTQELLFEDDSYSFPRPPLAVCFAFVAGSNAAPGDCDFLAVAVHLKAGVSDSDAARRAGAMTLLEQYVRTVVDGDGNGGQVILLGDFNEVLDTPGGREVWSPLLGDPERYHVHTTDLAANALSFLPAERLLDHFVSTAALADELAGGTTQIPRLDRQVEDYERAVSDHLPVVTSMPGIPASTP